MFPVKNKYQLPVIDSRDKIMLDEKLKSDMNGG